MSKLSAQCDELRAVAESVGLAVPQAATLMMGAADTICELRNKCDDLVGERERLFRANVEKNNEMLRLARNNAKLRELVRAAWRCIHTGASCSDCRLIAGGCTLQTAMRELGIEV